MERETGLEPAISCLGSRRITTMLLPQYLYNVHSLPQPGSVYCSSKQAHYTSMMTMKVYYRCRHLSILFLLKLRAFSSCRTPGPCHVQRQELAVHEF
jgi:hypothetical protein